MPTQNRTALPVLVAHSAVLQVPAVVMSIVGGLLIYGTIISFGRRMYDVEESVGSVRSKDARGGSTVRKFEKWQHNEISHTPVPAVRELDH